ncbi:MAG: alpha/beta hydrolase [Acidimicrobiales bacterium]|nr:alpha/beta hydrolase [Acidimicrobiales bacterium]
MTATPPPVPDGLELRRVDLDGLDVAYLADPTADSDAPLAVLLHGFPDAATTWRHLLPALTAAGFRAVAPWLRGYAPTAVPADGLYQVGALARDACLLHDALGGDERAVVVGHDWGAMATYAAAGWQPERWRRAVTMAVPPAGAMFGGFTSYDQLRRSWYMFFFQHPLAEAAVAADDLGFVARLWRDWSPGHDPVDDLPAVRAALRDPANLAAALGYYRATLGDGPTDPALDDAQAGWMTPTPIPTLYLHGADDGCLGAELVTGAAAALPAPGSRAEVLDGVGHFLHVEDPDRVDPLVVEFLTGEAP